MLLVLTALPFVAPLMALVALAVRCKLGTPVFFRQQRPGYKGQPFRMVKFRTMTDARDVDGSLLPDELRMTRLGQLLRSTSLDELPELLNVLKGEMALVGPRPLLMEYLDLYTPEQRRRHDAVPGITGWAQVNGRNAVDWEHRFRLDVWYVDHVSLWVDLRIMLLTVSTALSREGVCQPGRATVEYFTGTQS